MPTPADIAHEAICAYLSGRASLFYLRTKLLDASVALADQCADAEQARAVSDPIIWVSEVDRGHHTEDELRVLLSDLVTPVKFAAWVMLDQTWGYVPLDPEESATTQHGRAGLWNTREEAQAAHDAYMLYIKEEYRDRVSGGVEIVFDVAEFQAREDTW